MHTYNFHPKLAFTFLKHTHTDDLDLMGYSTNSKKTCKLYCSNKVSPFSTINPFIYALWHTFKHTQEYTMYRFGLIGLAWSSTIMDSTMELVSPNGDHHQDGLIVPTIDHFKSIRGGAL